MSQDIKKLLESFDKQPVKTSLRVVADPPVFVSKYQCTTYYNSTGSSDEREYHFTPEHAKQVGAEFTNAGIEYTKARELCDKWNSRENRRGKNYDIRRSCTTLTKDDLRQYDALNGGRQMNESVSNVPAGATHYSEFYGDTNYYQKREYQHLNDVSEEWQTLVKWFYWDDKKQQWVDVGSGFSDRRLKPLNESTEEVDPSIELEPGEEELTERKKKKKKKRASFVGVPYGFGRDECCPNTDAAGLSEDLQKAFEDFLSSEYGDDGLQKKEQDDAYAAWQKKVIADNPGKNIKFLSKPDQPGVISAEVPGEDRSYGIYRMDTQSGEQLGESAPPGMEDVVLDLKKQYPEDESKAFATAWSIYNKKHGKNEVKEGDDELIDDELLDEDDPSVLQQLSGIASGVQNTSNTVTNASQTTQPAQSNTTQPVKPMTPQDKAAAVAQGLKTVMNDPASANAFKTLLGKLK